MVIGVTASVGVTSSGLHFRIRMGVKHVLRLHDRYFLHMQSHVGFNFGGTRLTSYAEPTFVLSEVSDTTLFTGGGASIAYASGHHFGLTEWETLVASGGDFAAIGIMLKEDQPVKGLAEFWQLEQRKHGK